MMLLLLLNQKLVTYNNKAGVKKTRLGKTLSRCIPALRKN